MQVPKNRMFEIITDMERDFHDANPRVIKWKSQYRFSGMSKPVIFKNINDKQYAAKISDDSANEWLVAFDGIEICAFTKKSADGKTVFYEKNCHDAEKYAEEIRWLQGIAAQGYQCRKGFV